MLSDSAREFSGAPESTCSYECAFRMLRDLTIRIVNFWNGRELHAGLYETSRAALGETWCLILNIVVRRVP